MSLARYISLDSHDNNNNIKNDECYSSVDADEVSKVVLVFPLSIRSKQTKKSSNFSSIHEAPSNIDFYSTRRSMSSLSNSNEIGTDEKHVSEEHKECTSGLKKQVESLKCINKN